MNAPTAKAVIPTTPGTPFEGGFYVGQYRMDGAVYALIVAPREADVGDVKWIEGRIDVPTARTFNDGFQNTMAMDTAGSTLAKTIRALQIGGFSDWYLPARDELELLYRYLKPTSESNYTWRSGENPSALPATYPYTEELPAQTSASAFSEGGNQALGDAAYWSSTQYSRSHAWFQLFVDGSQGSYGKSAELRARAVRRFKVD